jgi:hypothetical protein
MIRTGTFTLVDFMNHSNLKAKHPEIFATDRAKEAKKIMEKFEAYTKDLNKSKNVEKFVEKLKKEYGMEDQVAQSIEPAHWNEHYFNYDVPETKNAKINDVWIFPHNETGKKIKIDSQFYVNCIKLGSVKPESIQLANRNGHMVLMGEIDNSNNVSDNSKELGVGFSFKILILYNHKNKKYIVSPFKMVSVTDNDVNCRAFGQSASTDDVYQQFNAWKYEMKKHGDRIGLVNYRFLDPKFKDLPNLFTPDQSQQLLTEAKRINNSTNSGGSKKKSVKKKSVKKKSVKKKSVKKKSVKKKSVKKKSVKKKSVKKKS